LKTKSQKRESTKEAVEATEMVMKYMVDEEIKESHVSMITTEIRTTIITMIDKSKNQCLEIYLKKHPTISA